MNKYKKRMNKRILNHALEIISLLTGKVSLLQHLATSLIVIEVTKDQKITDMILSHALEIIYLLTGEEYSIVKKNSPHRSIDSLTEKVPMARVHLDLGKKHTEVILGNDLGRLTSVFQEEVHPVTAWSQANAREPEIASDDGTQWDIDDHKKVMNDNHKTLSMLGIRANKSPDLHDKGSEKGEDETVENDILRVAIHSSLSVGAHDENVYTASINEDGQYMRDENDILQVKIHSHPCEGYCNEKRSMFTMAEEEEPDVRGPQLVKQEEIPLNISNDGNMSCDVRGGSYSPTCVSQVQVIIGASTKNVKKKQATNCAKLNSKTIDFKIEEKLVTEELVHTNKKQTTLRSKLHVALQQTQKIKKPFVCSDCEKVFTIESDLVKHYTTHSGLKPTVTQEYDFDFSHIASLKTQNRTQERPYVCPDCGKGFSQKASLNAHQRTHTGEKPYVCSDCGKGFSQKASLNAHRITHTREKPYICPDCCKGFSHRASLNKHHMTHTRGRAFVCTDCGKGFSQRANLITHHRTHTGEKPYVCTDCGKGFSQSTSLHTHHRTHTGEKPYVCPVCGKGFSQRASLNAHHITHTK